MKTSTRIIALILFAAYLSLMPSCINAKGANWSVTAVGNNAESFVVNSEGLNIQKLNQTDGLTAISKFAASSWRNFLLAKAWTFIAGKYYDMKGAELSKDTTIKLEELRNAKSIADADAALKVLNANNAAAAAAAAR